MAVGEGTLDNPVYIVIGPSGAGLTTALNVFREFGYTTMAGASLNGLRQAFPTLAAEHPTMAFHLAFAPQNSNIQEIKGALESFKLTIPHLKILYLSTPTDVLLQRYNLSQRPHPYIEASYDLRYTIEQEQLIYQALRPLADYHIDTSHTTDEELKLKIAKILNIPVENNAMELLVMSFGFKRGAPTEADYVFDVRFLPNPFYDINLRPMTGLDKPVQDYVMGYEETCLFLEHLSLMFKNLIPAHQKQGKTRLTIAIGCTGGQHRSVFMSEMFTRQLQADFPDVTTRSLHREMPHWPSNASDISSATSEKAAQ